MHTKWTARRLAADAMFAAMVTVLGLASISTGNLKITVEALPVFLGALLLGPVDGLAIGGVGTLLYQLLRFGVSATTALWIVPYVLLGLCVGAVSARHGYACTPRQLALLAVLGELGITVLNTGSLYVDSLIYGYYSPVFVFGTLPLRLAICAGKGIVLALLLPTLLRVARRALQPRVNCESDEKPPLRPERQFFCAAAPDAPAGIVWKSLRFPAAHSCPLRLFRRRIARAHIRLAEQVVHAYAVIPRQCAQHLRRQHPLPALIVGIGPLRQVQRLPDLRLCQIGVLAQIAQPWVSFHVASPVTV